MLKKMLLLPVLFLGLLTFAQAQSTAADTNKKCDAKKACCATKKDGTKAACCSDKSKASCDSKSKKSAFVKKTATTKVVATENASVTVAGVCGMCKMRIEKAASAVDGVATANWDDIKQILTVSYDGAKVDLQTIEKAVAAVGHDTQNVKASDEAYANLHGCCKYPRS